MYLMHLQKQIKQQPNHTESNKNQEQKPAQNTNKQQQTKPGFIEFYFFFYLLFFNILVEKQTVNKFNICWSIT